MAEAIDDALCFRNLGDGRGLWLRRQIYNWQLAIGPILSREYDDQWEYLDGLVAIHAMAEWNPLLTKEPTGWVRHPPSGRRRFPDGDPTTEEVRP